MHAVRSVRHLGGYELLLGFEDGSLRRVDLQPYLDGEVFEPLTDLEYFATVRLDPDLDTIVWDNGADFCPDFLYRTGRSEECAEGA